MIWQKGVDYVMKKAQKERPAETGRTRREISLINVSIGDFQSIVKFIGIAFGLSAFAISVGWSIGVNIFQ